MPEWWRIDEDDGRFARDRTGAWTYGPAAPRLEGLPVPGARDVTLAELGDAPEDEVVGMSAPELGDGFERRLALAEREVRVWRRMRADAARRRAVLVGHARHSLGASGCDIARWIGVSRNRIQQLCDVSAGGPAGPLPDRVDDAARAVKAAHVAFVHAGEMLHEAEAIRRQRVAEACDLGRFSLGRVADVLDVSRVRAQQLRDAGRERMPAAA